MNDGFQNIFNVDFLRVSVGIHEEEILLDIYEEFIANIRDMLKLFESGEIGREAVYIAVHNHKASSRSVGAIHLADVIDRVEPDILDETSDFRLHLHPLKLAAIQTVELVERHVARLKEKRRPHG